MIPCAEDAGRPRQSYAVQRSAPNSQPPVSNLQANEGWPDDTQKINCIWTIELRRRCPPPVNCFPPDYFAPLRYCLFRPFAVLPPVFPEFSGVFRSSYRPAITRQNSLEC